MCLGGKGLNHTLIAGFNPRNHSLIRAQQSPQKGNLEINLPISPLEIEVWWDSKGKKVSSIQHKHASGEMHPRIISIDLKETGVLR